MAWDRPADDTLGNGDGGVTAPVWTPLRVDDAESGDFTTPGFDNNAPSQFISGSEDASGITLEVRDRTFAADMPTEAFGWILPMTVLPAFDVADRNQIVMFRITPVTQFPDSSTAWMGCGIVDSNGAMLAAGTRLGGGQIQRIGVANSNRFGLVKHSTEVGFNSQADARAFHVLATRYANAIQAVPFGFDGSGVATVTLSVVAAAGVADEDLRIYIAGGIESLADTGTFTGKYQLEAAVAQVWPAGTWP